MTILRFASISALYQDMGLATGVWTTGSRDPGEILKEKQGFVEIWMDQKMVEGIMRLDMQCLNAYGKQSLVFEGCWDDAYDDGRG